MSSRLVGLTLDHDSFVSRGRLSEGEGRAVYISCFSREGAHLCPLVLHLPPTNDDFERL